jgi:hypothetical protein
MTRSRLATGFVLLLVLLAVPTVAQADGLGRTNRPTLELKGGMFDVDPIWHTSYRATIVCMPVEQATAKRCTATVTLAGVRVDPRRGFRHIGSERTITTARVDLAVGESTTITLRTPVSRLRDPLIRSSKGAELTLRYPDPTGLAKPFPIASSFILATAGYTGTPCGLPAWVAYSASTPVQHLLPVASGPSWIASPRQDINSQSVIRTQATTTFRLHGLTYTMPARSQFQLTCHGVRAVSPTQLFPSIALLDGQVHVTGTPTGGWQLAAGVFTSEGSLGSRKREAVDMTITRNARKQLATLAVKKGSSGIVVPKRSTRAVHCDRGERLAVNRFGTITAL